MKTTVLSSPRNSLLSNTRKNIKSNNQSLFGMTLHQPIETLRLCKDDKADDYTAASYIIQQPE